MPKFTQEELEEIRRNTEEVEKARKGKKRGGDDDGDEQPKPKKPRRKTKKEEEYSIKDRMLALVLLAVTIGVSLMVWQLF